MAEEGKDDGAWIFVSHSHKDLKAVREIRNELERRGHRPIMFYLKCLEDDDAVLPDLLRREIEARTWFILCDSPNSRASTWVQREKEIVKSLKGKVYQEVDISRGLEPERDKVVELAKRATVFLSYAHTDRQLAQRIARSLRRADFQVFLDVDLFSGTSDILSALHQPIDDAVAKGLVLALLSPDSLRSEWVRHETLYALERARALGKSNVVPIVISDRDSVFNQLPLHLATIQCFDLTTGDFDRRIAELITDLKTREME